MEVGDRYIEDSVAGFLKTEANPDVDDIIASIFPGSGGGKVVFCEDCTELGGDYLFSTVYGDEEVESGL